MRSRKDIEEIKSHVLSRIEPPVQVQESWYTSTGRQRNAPQYEALVENEYLGKRKTLVAASRKAIEREIEKQILKWKNAEIRQRIERASEQSREQANDASRSVESQLESLLGILEASLARDPRIDWEIYRRSPVFVEFTFRPPPQKTPPPPLVPLPPRPATSWFSDWEERAWKQQCDAIQAQYNAVYWQWEQDYLNACKRWEEERQQASQEYSRHRQEIEAQAASYNEMLDSYRVRFESGESSAIVEYLEQVFELSSYPDDVTVEHLVSYDAGSGTAVVDLVLPGKEIIPEVSRFRFVKSRGETRPVKMDEGELDLNYNEIVRQSVLRTLREVFGSVYTDHVGFAAINACINRLDEATGNDVRVCILSVATDRDRFGKLRLDRKGIDLEKCLDSLNAQYAGKPHEFLPISPVQSRASMIPESSWDDRLKDIDNHLDRLTWGQFEDLAGVLFRKMFVGARVEVTQRTRDGGADVIVDDPDPLRGGKFVVQVKKYSNLVPLNDVKALLGTMREQSAVRGFLVTTSRFGPDSKAFARKNFIALIDRENLLKLLERHGVVVPAKAWGDRK